MIVSDYNNALPVNALTTGAVVMTAEAASKSGNETVSISEYTGWGDPAMAKIAIDSGRALVAHLSTARALLDNGQVAEARNALIVSREFADTIERTMPYLTVGYVDVQTHVALYALNSLTTVIDEVVTRVN